MEISHIVNENIHVTSDNAVSLYERLPLAKRSLADFILSETPIYHSERNAIHQPVLLFNGEDGSNACWYLYISITGTHTCYALKTTNPSGTWELVTNEGEETPKPIIEQTEDWENPAYGCDSLKPVRCRHSYGGQMYNYLGFYTYKDLSGYYKTAVAHSIDAITWVGKTQLVLDSSITTNTAQNRYINAVLYDAKEEMFYAVFSFSYNSRYPSYGAMGMFCNSIDGVNWTKVGIIPTGSSSEQRGEDSCASTLLRFGNLFVAATCCYSYAEVQGDDVYDKNVMLSYSLDGIIWQNDCMPVIEPDDKFMRDIRMAVTNGSIYCVWVDGNWDIRLARIERSFNPPVVRKVGNLSANSSRSLTSYITGDKKNCLMILQGSASEAVSIEVEIVAAITDNQRMVFKKVTTETHTVEVDAAGDFIQAITIDSLPHLFDVKITNGSASAITGVEFEIQG